MSLDLTNFNVKLAREVAAHLRAHPDTFTMDIYIEETDCGVTACIAGRAWLLTHPGWNEYPANVRTLASRLFGLLTEKDKWSTEYDKVKELFYWDEWPAEFLRRYQQEDSTSAVAADYLEQLCREAERLQGVSHESE